MEQAEAFQMDQVIDNPEIDEQPTIEETEAEELDTLEDDEQTEVPEIEMVEIDINGEKYSVPKELEGGYLRQDDYTRKTQEVAEQRRALEQAQAQFQQVQQIQQLNQQGHAQLAALQNQIVQYQNLLNDPSYTEQDPNGAQRAFIEYSQLKDAAANLQTSLQQQEQQALNQQQAMLAQQIEQSKAELARDIPNWSTELYNDILLHAVNKYGASQQRVNNIVDPVEIKILHKAYLYDQMKEKAVTPPKPQLKSAAKVKGKGKVNVDPDKMSTEEWLAWRQKQIK